MKTLEEIKDEVAKEKGFVSWDNLVFVNAGFIWVVQPFNDEATKRFALEVAKDALRNAAENARLDYQYFQFEDAIPFVNKESIISETNIPEL